jgi:ubiquinone/menaquinone biosynthesis C-methylase UbiE
MDTKTAYEAEWDEYSRSWDPETVDSAGDCVYLGDEWGSGHLERYALYVKPYLPPEATVLEIGPGGGRLTELLLKDCRELIALEVSSEMLSRLLRRFHKEPKLRPVKGTGLDLVPLPDRSIDCVVSYDVFVHLEPEDIYAYLIDIRRVLREGGRGILHFSNVLSDAGFERFRETFRLGQGGRRHVSKFSCMSLAVMEKFVRSLGFDILYGDDRKFHQRDALIVFEMPAA